MINKFSPTADSPTKRISDSVIVVSALIHTLKDVFKSAGDIYIRLKRRQQSDSNGINGRRPSLDSPVSKTWDEPIRHASDTVQREYEQCNKALGGRFAVGDLLAQNQILAEITTLQTTVIQIHEDAFYDLQGKTVTPNIEKLLSVVLSVRAGTVNALRSLFQRMDAEIPDEGLPVAFRPRSSSDRGSVISTATYTSSGIAPSDAWQGLYCPYALELQTHPNQPLAEAFKSRSGDSRCPMCVVKIPASPSHYWKITKETGNESEDTYKITNRFIVKSHRGPGKGFGCVLCSREGRNDTAYENVKTLIDHLWLDHRPEQFAKEVDIQELD